MAESENRTLQDKFMLRLPDGMRDRLKAAAEANNRSLNAEIITRLGRTLSSEGSNSTARQGVALLSHKATALMRQIETLQRMIEALPDQNIPPAGSSPEKAHVPDQE